jgi:hypothetical protein
MKLTGCVVVLTLCGVLVPGYSQDVAKPGPPVRLEEAMQLSISSLRNGQRLHREEFRLTVRRKDNDWVLWFEFPPQVYGEDVTVIVHPDGTTTVVPGF